jgi:type IV pilus assembly protein PilC
LIREAASGQTKTTELLERTEMIRWIRNILYAVMIALVVLLVIAFASNDDPHFRSSIAIPMLLCVLGPAAIIGIVVLIRESGFFEPRRHAWLALSYLEQAVRMNLPLARVLLAAEISEGGLAARSLKRLRLKLESGLSISDSVRQGIPLIPNRTVALLQASENVGRVGDELVRAIGEQSSTLDTDPADDSFVRSYPIILLMIIFGVTSLIMIFVIPKFRQIFADFRIELPPVTQAVINFMNAFDVTGWLLVALAGAVLMASTTRIKWFRRRHPLAGLHLSRNLADICHVIASALEAGAPLNTAIRSGAALSVGRRLRKKLHRWAEGIESGLPSAQAAESAGMPRLITAMTSTADVTAAAEAFQFLAGYYALKFSRLMTMIRAMAVPAMTFFFGGIVAIVVLALFLPLIALIDSVMPMRGLP